MTPTYRSVCILSAGIAVFLSLSYLLIPGLVLQLFGVPQSESANLMSGRAAILFAALGMIYWFTRDTHHRPTRIAVLKSSALAMTAMLVFGLWQVTRGFAGPLHLTASSVEAVYLVAFCWTWRIEATKASAEIP